MPRRKGTGSRGNSPDKPIYNGGRGGVTQIVIPTQTQKGNYMTDDTQSQGISCKGRIQTLDQHNETYKTLQEMFKGRIDPDVVHLVLSECDWKGEKAYESLTALVQASPVTMPQEPTSNMTEGQGLVNHSSQPQHTTNSAGQKQTQPRPQLHLRSRLPSVNPESSSDAASLPILSPRTPMVIDPNFFPMSQGANNDMQTALSALDLYGQNMYLESAEPDAGFGDHQFLEYHQQQGYPTTDSDAQYSQYLKPSGGTNNVHGHHSLQQNFDPSQNIPNFSHPSPQHSPQPPFHMEPQSNYNYSMTYVNDFLRQSQSQPQNQISPQAQTVPQHQHMNQQPHLDSHSHPHANMPGEAQQYQPEQKQKHKQQLTSVRQESSSPVSKRQSIRKHTISLNPEERDSLEKLIDEVLKQGFSEEFNDSDSSDTETEEPVSPSSNVSSEGMDKTKNSNSGKDKKSGGKQPSTLKVAAKHMKNIPPRFLKKLQAIQTVGKPDEDGVFFTDENIQSLVRGDSGEESDKRNDMENVATRIPITEQQALSNFEKKNTFQSVNNVERGNITTSEITSPPQAYMPSPIIQAPIPLSCEDLERNLLGGLPPAPGKVPKKKKVPTATLR